MGIIKASMTALRGAAADQWKEMFCAGEMQSDLLMKRAKRITGQSGNNNGSGEVITDGSLIIVGQGECAIATEGGRIIGIYDQPGEQIFKSNQSSGIFGGHLGAFAKDVGRRIAFGGDVGISQRMYYINTKELTGGTIRAEGVPLRFRDQRAGIDVDGSINCYGIYTFRIADPERFFKAAFRSADDRYRKTILRQMDSEVLTALPTALTQLTQEGIRPNELPMHTEALCEKLRQAMSDQWSGLRGIEVFSVALKPILILDAAMMRTMQRDVAFQDPIRAAAHLTGAKADAMQTAAVNDSGAYVLTAAIMGKPPAEHDRWKCTCGFENSGKFCMECGTKKPASHLQYSCRYCGWKAEENMQTPKFCCECGAPFDV